MAKPKKNTKKDVQEEIKEETVKENIEETEEKNESNQEEIKEAEKNEASDSDEIQNLRDEILNAKDKLLRKVAEFDNFKKRTVREKAENFSLGACDAVEKLLPVLDSLDRAILSAEQTDEQNSLLDGIKMIRKQFEEALSKIGVSEIEAVGKEFDPELHNAMMAEDSDKGSNIVLEELMKGYVYISGDNKRVIRHSMVKVSN